MVSLRRGLVGNNIMYVHIIDNRRRAHTARHAESRRNVILHVPSIPGMPWV